MKKLTGHLLLTAIIAITLLSSSLPVSADSGSDLRFASFEGLSTQVKTLLADGADVNARSKDGETALMIASLS